MTLDEVKINYPFVHKAFESLLHDTDGDELPGSFDESLAELFPKAEKFLALLDEEAFETFVYGDPDDAEEIGRGVRGREEASLVCESYHYGFDPDEAKEDRETRNYGG